MLKTALLKVKAEYLIRVVRFMYVPRRSCSRIFLVTKEEKIVKMVDGSACEVNRTGTVKVIKRDGMVRALERSHMSRRQGTI